MDQIITQPKTQQTPAWVLIARTLIAVIQAGLLSWLLSANGQDRVWPATVPELWLPLLTMSFIVPTMLQLDLGHVPTRRLLLWAFTAALISALLGYYDIFKQGSSIAEKMSGGRFYESDHYVTSIIIEFFIAHIFVTELIKAQGWRAQYANYFSSSWKRAAQIVLSSVFAILFWFILSVTTDLFSGQRFYYEISNLIHNTWFLIPILTFSFCLSLHVTDIQPALIRSARMILLTLLSWLLPIASLIIAIYLVNIPIITNQSFNAKHVFLTTLSMIPVLIFLINCTYQDGILGRSEHRIKKISANLAALELIPLSIINCIYLWSNLVSEKSSLTIEDIYLVAEVVLACFYALGYGIAALPFGGRWMHRIELTNIFGAVLTLFLIIVLASPIADPARLVVNNNISRLISGTTLPVQFDFAKISREGGYWADRAFADLATKEDGQNTARIKELLADYASKKPLPPKSAIDLRMERVAVFPEGRSIPDIFYQAEFWNKETGLDSPCLSQPTVIVSLKKCLVRFVTLPSGGEEIILWYDQFDGTLGYIFKRNGAGVWYAANRLIVTCPHSFDTQLMTSPLNEAMHRDADLLFEGESIIQIPAKNTCTH